MYYWHCTRRDIRHGCFSPDFDGYCTAKSKKGYKTKIEAETAGEKHKCRFNGYGYSGNTEVIKLHGNSYEAKHW